MKKLLSFSLALLMLTACGKANNQTADFTSMDAVAQYKYATEKLNKVTSYSADTTMNMSIDLMGESQTVDMTMFMKFENPNDPTKMIASIDTQVLDIQQQMYIKDMTMYSNVDGVKTKVAIDQATVDQLLSEGAAQSYDEKMMKNLSSTSSNDTVTITYELSEDYINQVVAAQLGADASMLEGVELNITKANGELVCDNQGNVTVNTIDMDIAMTIEGTELKMTYKIVMNIQDVDNTKVELPSDLDTYEEVSM